MPTGYISMSMIHLVRGCLYDPLARAGESSGGPSHWPARLNGRFSPRLCRLAGLDISNWWLAKETPVWATSAISDSLNESPKKISAQHDSSRRTTDEEHLASRCLEAQ